MPQSRDANHVSSVQQMFTRIAALYIRADRWMTLEQDIKWRRQVISLANLPRGGKLLDIGTGYQKLISY